MFELRPATDKDLLFCMSVGHEGLRPHLEAAIGWNQQENEQKFRDGWDPREISIIRHMETDVGYISRADSSTCLTIDGIYIAKAWRNRGLGEAVLSSILVQTSNPVSLRVYKTNPAFRLYRRLGFEIIDECELRYQMEWRPKAS